MGRRSFHLELQTERELKLTRSALSYRADRVVVFTRVLEAKAARGCCVTVTGLEKAPYHLSGLRWSRRDLKGRGPVSWCGF